MTTFPELFDSYPFTEILKKHSDGVHHVQTYNDKILSMLDRNVISNMLTIMKELNAYMDELISLLEVHDIIDKISNTFKYDFNTRFPNKWMTCYLFIEAISEKMLMVAKELESKGLTNKFNKFSGMYMNTYKEAVKLYDGNSCLAIHLLSKSLGKEKIKKFFFKSSTCSKTCVVA